MAYTQEELISEEQEILDKLIQEMDEAILQLDKRLTYNEPQSKKAKEACLPDAYGMLVSSNDEKMEARQRARELKNGKDELYHTRLKVEATDDMGRECIDIKIGLHTYKRGARVFITSWQMPVCRHYIMDNASEEYDSIVNGNYGEKFKTHYQLQLKRKVNVFFDKVEGVTHFFPILNEEAEQIVADEFLQELLKRRSGQEFKNIVFSIQKKQGEIIQTPFMQNLIVQGCAGSGKSMIMLHRLPIILYDNPNSLDRNNLYIITPSISYIQMADHMRIDLEIEDLKMGTLEQYYDHVLKKYGIKPEVYGKIKPYIKLKEADIRYVYSNECVTDIYNQIEKIFDKGVGEYRMGYKFLNIPEQKEGRVSVTPFDRIRKEIVMIQDVIEKNDVRLREYHRNIYDLLTQLEELARILESRKIIVTRSISRKISEAERTIAEKEKDISKIENRDEHKVMYENRKNSIRAAENKISDLKETLEIVELDEEYFENLKKKTKQIRQLLALFETVKRDRRDMTLSEQYKAIANRRLLIAACEEIEKETVEIEDPYWEYADSITSIGKKLEPFLERISGNNNSCLPLDYLQKLINIEAYYLEEENKGIQKIYLSIMKNLGQEPDEKGRLDALECSPYLYLQIVYLFNGMPNGARESLITIDEAQNVAPEELRLIKAVNGEGVVLNLFGDEKQHVEYSKGIDNWKEISDIADFKTEYMQENYRNARQITEYCNKRFNLQMRSINLDGAGVHELKSKQEFEENLEIIFQKPQNVGLSCIIVKNIEEAENIINMVGNHANRIHNMSGELTELQKNKWNMMTVDQVKGLEFETVFAITGRMSENEKYIAYTRALDELYVYDFEIKLSKIMTKTRTVEITEKKKKVGSTRKKREKRRAKEMK